MSDTNSGDMFDFKLEKWVLSADECAFTSLSAIGKDKPLRQYLIESIDNWVNKQEVFLTDKFILEMCDFIKGQNEDLYDRLIKKCALKGVSVGEGIFEALSLPSCSMLNEQQCAPSGDNSCDK
ncbi:MAG: hypothetical protein ABFD18_18300 [Syntrophomonas sp.]